VFCRSPRASAGGDKTQGIRNGVKSLWEPWCSAQCCAVADAGRTRGAAGNSVSPIFCSCWRLGCPNRFRKKWRHNRKAPIWLAARTAGGLLTTARASRHPESPHRRHTRCCSLAAKVRLRRFNQMVPERFFFIERAIRNLLGAFGPRNGIDVPHSYPIVVSVIGKGEHRVVLHKADAGRSAGD